MTKVNGQETESGENPAWDHWITNYLGTWVSKEPLCL